MVYTTPTRLRENSKRPNFGSLWRLFQKKRSRKDTKFGTQHLRNPLPSGHHQPNKLQRTQSHTRRNTTHKTGLPMTPPFLTTEHTTSTAPPILRTPMNTILHKKKHYVRRKQKPSLLFSLPISLSISPFKSKIREQPIPEEKKP